MKRERMEELQLPEGFCKLLRRFRRGGILFHSLYLILLGCAGGALVCHLGISWAIAAFILCLVCRLTVLLSIGRKYISACNVAENPQIVYWGHSMDRQGRAIDTPVTESKNILLHLKDGTQVEVEAVRGTGVSQTQLREIIFWLRQRNPSIRWGDYDKPSS